MEAGTSRKRLRRSTRSCYQCTHNRLELYLTLIIISWHTIPGRKRKVKCQLIDEKVDTCAECVKSGTQCTIQPPEAELSSEGSPIYVDKEGQEARLERIESLLKRLVEAQEQSRPAESSFECESIVPASLWNDFVSSIWHFQLKDQILRQY